MFTSNDSMKPFDRKVWLSSPTMHGEELKYTNHAVKTNWVSTIGENINEIERLISEKIGFKYAVALASGTAAIHLCTKLANVERGDLVASSDLTFAATTEPIIYEGGVPVFIDSEYDTWNMDPKALDRALYLFPEIKTVIIANLYGTPAKLADIQHVCKKHSKKNDGREIILIEDAAESLGATYRGQETGSFGTYNAISFNGNKIITGSSGGMLLTNDLEAANLARKWSTQSREPARWYQHEDLGYNYRMSNIIAGFIRGQLPYLDEHISQKKAIYMRYKEGFKDLPIQMNPYDEKNSEPNFWLSCILIDDEAMCRQERDDLQSKYYPEHGKSCPAEIFEALADYNAESRPIWKPLSQQPFYKNSPFVSKHTMERSMTNNHLNCQDNNVGCDIFHRGLCLPSDNKMTPEEQDRVIDIVKACFE